VSSSNLDRNARKLRQSLKISERPNFSPRNSVVAGWSRYESVSDFDISLEISEKKLILPFGC